MHLVLCACAFGCKYVCTCKSLRVYLCIRVTGSRSEQALSERDSAWSPSAFSLASLLHWFDRRALDSHASRSIPLFTKVAYQEFLLCPLKGLPGVGLRGRGELCTEVVGSHRPCSLPLARACFASVGSWSKILGEQLVSSGPAVEALPVCAAPFLQLHLHHQADLALDKPVSMTILSLL